MAAAAIVALATLVAFPWFAIWRLDRVRLDTAETIAPARRIVRDMSAALVLDDAVWQHGGAASGAARTRRDSALSSIERAHDAALADVAPRFGGRLAAEIARFRSMSAQWRAQRDGAASGPALTVAEVLRVGTQLDSALGERQAGQVVRIRALEADVALLPSALVPLLGLVVLAIYWTGRRMAALAADADRHRLALAVAAEQRVALLRGLTHDLKNSLGAAMGYAELLLEETAGSLTALQREHAMRIDRIIKRTIGAVEDALTVARTEAGALPMRRQREDLRALSLESASDFVAAAERAGLTLTVEFADDLPAVDTDPTIVSKIIGNLLSNAI